MRIFGATVVVLSLAAVMSAVGLFFLMQGAAVENSALTRQIEAGVQKLVGPDYAVELGTTTIGFDPAGLLSVSGMDVELRRATDRRLVSKLGRIVIGVRPWSILTGENQIDAVIIEDTTLQASLLPLPPPNPDLGVEQGLNALRDGLHKATAQFQNARFRLFQFRNVTLEGLGAGRREVDPVVIDSFELRYRRSGLLTAATRLRTNLSQVDMTSTWTPDDGSGGELAVSMTGLSTREWLADPEGEGGQVALDARLSAEIRVPYDREGNPGRPAITAGFEDARLRIGAEAVTEIDEAFVSISLLAEKNQIELDAGSLRAGPLEASLVGGVRPEAGAGWASMLRFELIARPAIRQATVEGEPVIPLFASVTGTFDPKTRIMEMETVQMLAGNDRLHGNATVRFEKPSPAIRASFTGDGFPVAALKQSWPFFLAPPARNWVFANITGGRLERLSLEADLPPGIFGRFRIGAKMNSDQFALTAGFRDVRVRTFGELPAIEEGIGIFTMRGMAVEASLSQGKAILPDGRTLPLETGSYRVGDFAVRPNIAEVRISTSGQARDLSAVAEARPLGVMSRLKLDPAHVNGEAEADIVAQFPVKRGLTVGEVNWNAIVNLREASTTDKVFGKAVSRANVLIEANSEQARITGNAVVDGTRTELALVEPIGKSGIEGTRRIAAVLDEAGRRKMGLNLDPVVSGTIEVEIEQKQSGPERQTVRLDDAEIHLPWVGWSKGKGIAGKATYTLRKENGITWLDDFFIDGPGFSAAGRLALDRGGLLHADFADIALNEGDSFSLKLDRKGKAYRIAIGGLRYDARSLITKLFHERSVGEAAGEANVTVSASLGEVKGFNNRTLKNVELSYGTAGGKFDNMSLRGSFSDTTYVSVFAVTADGATTFEIDSTEAGGALAFINVYNRMQGGQLRAKLNRTGSGPFSGPVRATNFVIENEPRLASLVSDPQASQATSPQTAQQVEELRRLDVKRVRFQEARAGIEKGEGYLRVSNGIFSNVQIGLTFDGMVFDERSRMDLVGTFLPAIGISRAIGAIPFVGEILGNGRDSGLIGVTFRLRGSLRDPQLEINPVSLVTPGVFRKVFEFRN